LAGHETPANGRKVREIEGHIIVFDSEGFFDGWNTTVEDIERAIEAVKDMAARR